MLEESQTKTRVIFKPVVLLMSGSCNGQHACTLYLFISNIGSHYISLKAIILVFPMEILKSEFCVIKQIN